MLDLFVVAACIRRLWRSREREQITRCSSVLLTTNLGDCLSLSTKDRGKTDDRDEREEEERESKHGERERT
jgi:hypothetical protein